MIFFIIKNLFQWAFYRSCYLRILYSMLFYLGSPTVILSMYCPLLFDCHEICPFAHSFSLLSVKLLVLQFLTIILLFPFFSILFSNTVINTVANTIAVHELMTSQYCKISYHSKPTFLSPLNVLCQFPLMFFLLWLLSIGNTLEQ